MLLPIEGAALEKVANNSELNIQNAKHTAQEAFRRFALKENWDSFSDDIDLISYNSVQNNWIATFHSWSNPDYYIGVQYAHGIVNVHISKMLTRSSDIAQDALPGL